MRKVDELYQGIDAAISEGKRAKEIAKEFDCSLPFVYIVLRRKGKSLERARKVVVTCDQVRELWEKGMSIMETAKALDCSRSTVIHRRNEITFGMSHEERVKQGLLPVNQLRWIKRDQN